MIYNNLSENMFPRTREHIDETIEEYDDSEPNRIPEKWTVPEFDTALTKYADKKNEQIISHKSSARINKLDLQEDDQSLGGYETCDDDDSANVNATRFGRCDNRDSGRDNRNSFRGQDNRNRNDRYSNNCGRTQFQRNDRGRQQYRSRDYSRGQSAAGDKRQDRKNVLLDDIRDYIDATYSDKMVRKFHYGRDFLSKKVFNKKMDSEQNGNWR